MIIIQFGTTGRIAQILSAAAHIAYTNCTYLKSRRDGMFVTPHNKEIGNDPNAILKAFPNNWFVVIDSSIDHTSTEAMIKHETSKRNLISKLNDSGRLERIIGMSSGITLIDPSDIRSNARHMMEYRRQKLAQESLFSGLNQPYFLPNLFTLVGPITYSSQSAAWAVILKARVQRDAEIVLNEPDKKMAWTSEFEIFSQALHFMINPKPPNVSGSIASGTFTLRQIATGDKLPFPSLSFSKGSQDGWLNNHYVPPSPWTDKSDLFVELLRALSVKS